MSFGYDRVRSPAARRIKHLRIDSVDSVDKGASGSRGSRGAVVTLMKRDFDASGATAEALLRIAKSDRVSKVELSALLHKLAASQREDGESEAQAFTKCITCDLLGRELFAIMQRAPGRDHIAQKAAERFGEEHPAGEHELTGEPPQNIGGDAHSINQSPYYKELMRAAEAHRRTPEGKGKSPAQAFTDVCTGKAGDGKGPELLQQDKAWHTARLNSMRAQAAAGI